MPRQARPKDNTLLEMAIVGYQSEIDKISARIAEINAQLRSADRAGQGAREPQRRWLPQRIRPLQRNEAR